MGKRLYRENRMDRLSSPEQLDRYIRVVNPGVWLILGAVLLFLTSVLLWSATGTLDVTVEAKGYSDGTSVYCYLNEEKIAAVKTGMEAYIGKEPGKVEFAAEIPDAYEAAVGTLGSEGIAHALNITEGDWRYKVILTGAAGEGICDVMIVIDRMNPISYLLEQ